MKVILVAPAWGNGWQPTLTKAFEEAGHKAEWVHTESDYIRLKYWFDACLCMWADEAAVLLSQQIKKPFYTFIRAYEVFTELPSQINWSNVKKLFYCNQNTADIAAKIFSETIVAQTKNLDCFVIPNWIDIEQYPFKERDNNLSIAMVCDLNFKKNIPLAIQILAELPDKYTLHIAGQCQDESLVLYMENLILSLGLERRVKMYERMPHKDIPGFLANKSYILSTSMREGCPMNVLEAMAMGIKPVVHNWPGAKDIFPTENIFSKVSDVLSILESPYKSKDYRAMVENNHSLNNARKLVELVTEH
jgi:glycosyltransferase involved in cell wall biosynthesis